MSTYITIDTIANGNPVSCISMIQPAGSFCTLYASAAAGMALLTLLTHVTGLDDRNPLPHPYQHYTGRNSPSYQTW